MLLPSLSHMRLSISRSVYLHVVRGSLPRQGVYCTCAVGLPIALISFIITERYAWFPCAPIRDPTDSVASVPTEVLHVVSYELQDVSARPLIQLPSFAPSLLTGSL